MKPNLRLPLLCLGALVAGTVNGLLGAGGGIVLIFVLAPTLGGISHNGKELYQRRDLMAISLSVMLPISAISATRYALMGVIDTGLILKTVLPAVLGGFLGGLLLDKLKEKLIMKLFAVIVIYSGISMILR